MSVLLVFGSILVFVVVLTALGIGAARMTRWLVHRMVERRHLELEELVMSGRLPRSWTGGNGAGSWTMWRCRRRLDTLAAEVERSTLVADEETRQELLERLSAVRARL